MFFRHMNTLKMLHNYMIFYHLLQNFVIKIMKIDFRVEAMRAIDKDVHLGQIIVTYCESMVGVDQG